MELETIVNLIMNNGMCIVIVAYFMYRDFKFMDTLKTTLTTLVDTVATLKDVIEDENEKKGEK